MWAAVGWSSLPWKVPWHYPLRSGAVPRDQDVCSVLVWSRSAPVPVPSGGVTHTLSTTAVRVRLDQDIASKYPRSWKSSLMGDGGAQVGEWSALDGVSGDRFAMDKLNYYEIVADIVPGLFLIVGIHVTLSNGWSLETLRELSVGGLGLLALLAYAVGNLLQAIGNLIESLWWKVWDGWPTEWIWNDENRRILTQAQRDKVFEKASRVLGVTVVDVKALKPSERRAVVSHIYTLLSKSGRTGRIDSFNGTYGLLRGTATASVVLSLLNILGQCARDRALLWGFIGAVALYRMHRFAQHYARELFLQFLEVAEPGGEGSRE